MPTLSAAGTDAGKGYVGQPVSQAFAQALGGPLRASAPAAATSSTAKGPRFPSGHDGVLGRPAGTHAKPHIGPRRRAQVTGQE